MTSTKQNWPANDGTRNEHIIGADDARRLKGDVLFVEVRAGAETDLADYRKGHIPSAVFGNVREIFAGPGSPTLGSLPLPQLDVLQSRVAAWGIGQETQIVVYGPQPAWVARGWWVLKWAGLKHVRLLDGGVEAWKDAGGALEEGDPSARAPASAPVALSAGHLPTIDIADVEGATQAGLLIDARDVAAYAAAPAAAGQPPAGHIPGAKNVPASLAWDQKGKLRSREELIDLFGSVGVTPTSDVTSYCGGGVLAAYEVLALRSIGIPAKLYVGSWSQWSADPARARANG